jgi:uncharacterized integral membrane protein
MADEEPSTSGPPLPRASADSAHGPDHPADLIQRGPDEPDATAQRGPLAESRGARFRRKAHRSRLYLNAFGAAALLIYVVALAVSNTHHVKVDWVFASSSPPLVWLVLLAAVLGWLLGLLVATVLRRRTRAPQSS